MFHTFALLHDDVMDRADVRRGRPAAQHVLAAEFPGAGGAWTGTSAAVLAGDLAVTWADALLAGCGAAPARLAAARAEYHTLKLEVMAGQYLDLRAGHRETSEADARRVALLKSARYTVTRPLLLGAALGGGAGGPVRAALAAYGDAVGVGYQLRDDLLGVFGDPARTGKSVSGDLRDGKHTVLVHHALEHADAAGGPRWRPCWATVTSPPPAPRRPAPCSSPRAPSPTSRRSSATPRGRPGGPSRPCPRPRRPPSPTSPAGPSTATAERPGRVRAGDIPRARAPVVR